MSIQTRRHTLRPPSALLQRRHGDDIAAFVIQVAKTERYGGAGRTSSIPPLRSVRLGAHDRARTLEMLSGHKDSPPSPEPRTTGVSSIRSRTAVVTGQHHRIWRKPTQPHPGDPRRIPALLTVGDILARLAGLPVRSTPSTWSHRDRDLTKLDEVTLIGDAAVDRHDCAAGV